jgi:hypothetical protein
MFSNIKLIIIFGEFTSHYETLLRLLPSWFGIVSYLSNLKSLLGSCSRVDCRPMTIFMPGVGLRMASVCFVVSLKMLTTSSSNVTLQNFCGVGCGRCSEWTGTLEIDRTGSVFSILSLLNPEGYCGPSLLPSVGLYGLPEINLRLRASSPVSLLIAFSKLSYLCSFDARFKGLRTGCCWTNWWCCQDRSSPAPTSLHQRLLASMLLQPPHNIYLSSYFSFSLRAAVWL